MSRRAPFGGATLAGLLSPSRRLSAACSGQEAASALVRRRLIYWQQIPVGQDSTCAKKALKNVCRPRPRPRPRHPCSEALTPPACAPPRPRALASPLSVRAALPQITSRPTPSLGPCANVSTASASQILLLKIAGSPSVTALSLLAPGRLLLSAAPQPPGVTAARDRDRCWSQRLPAPPPMPRWEGGPLKAAVFLVFHC